MLRVLLLATICAGMVQPAASRHRTDSAHIRGFRTSRCVTGQCFARHPTGLWRHPLTQSFGRRWRSGF